jgi:hypothetical protein
MLDDLARTKAELAATFIRWLAELDAPALSDFDTRPITATLSVTIHAGNLELGGLDFDRERLKTKTETRRIVSARPSPAVDGLDALLRLGDIDQLDGLLDPADA